MYSDLKLIQYLIIFNEYLKLGISYQGMYHRFANLISKLNFYKLIPYPMDNCFTGRRDRSRQMTEKVILYNYQQDRSRSVHSPGVASCILPV